VAIGWTPFPILRKINFFTVNAKIAVPYDTIPKGVYLVRADFSLTADRWLSVEIF